MPILHHQTQRRPYFTLQWHITGKCDQRCAHCYMFTDTYKQELENELSYEDCLKVIDDFAGALEKWEIHGRINFTGGDPLLREDLFDLIRYAREKDIFVGILGNPNHLDFVTAKKLKELGVMRYQISIDGMEETHDRLRGRKGLFKDALRALDVLEKVGIPSVVMFTLSKTNASDLIDLMNLVANKCSTFDFAHVVPLGHGADLKDKMFTPLEYRAFLLRVLEEYKKLADIGCKTHYGKKDNLWLLLDQELGLLKPLLEDKELIYGGCSIGMNGLAILADGTIYPCRRLPKEIGRVPEQKIRDIFIESKILNDMREYDQIEKCGTCELKQFCRGCRAIPYAINGNYKGKDPLCWKDEK